MKRKEHEKSTHYSIKYISVTWLPLGARFGFWFMLCGECLCHSMPLLSLGTRFRLSLERATDSCSNFLNMKGSSALKPGCVWVPILCCLRLEGCFPFGPRWPSC